MVWLVDLLLSGVYVGLVVMIGLCVVVLSVVVVLDCGVISVIDVVW